MTLERMPDEEREVACPHCGKRVDVLKPVVDENLVLCPHCGRVLEPEEHVEGWVR